MRLIQLVINARFQKAASRMVKVKLFRGRSDVDVSPGRPLSAPEATLKRTELVRATWLCRITECQVRLPAVPTCHPLKVSDASPNIKIRENVDLELVRS